MTVSFSFCLNIGWLYTRLVADNSWEAAAPAIGSIENSEPTEITFLLAGSPHLNESVFEFMAMYVVVLVLQRLAHLFAQGAPSANQTHRTAGSASSDAARASPQGPIPGEALPLNTHEPPDDPGQDAQHALCDLSRGMVSMDMRSL